MTVLTMSKCFIYPLLFYNGNYAVWNNNKNVLQKTYTIDESYTDYNITGKITYNSKDNYAENQGVGYDEVKTILNIENNGDLYTEIINKQIEYSNDIEDCLITYNYKIQKNNKEIDLYEIEDDSILSLLLKMIY